MMRDYGGDRISQLPDEVILHILSFLTAKPAVRTGVLSKRWARLWTFSPVLRLDQRDFFNSATGGGGYPPLPAITASFIYFADRVLALRFGSVCIARFELWWHHDFDIHRAATFLHHAMAHNVRELVLNISPPKGELKLPAALFRLHSLEELVLKPLLLATTTIALPSSVSLLKLRRLILEIIIAPTSLLENLISNCPALEDLHLRVKGPGELKISAPKLEKLDLICFDKESDLKIQFSAPRLAHSSCCFLRLLPQLFSLGNTQPLAFSGIQCLNIGDVNAIQLTRILGSLGNSKYLVLAGVVELLSAASDLSEHMPSLCSLRHLELMELLLNEDNSRAITLLLKSTINLEKLVIWNRKNKKYRSDMNGLIFDKLGLGCNLYHLKEITIIGFLGGEDELEIVNLLLKHSISLQYMHLKCVSQVISSFSHETKLKMVQNINALRKAYSTIKVFRV